MPLAPPIGRAQVPTNSWEPITHGHEQEAEPTWAAQVHECAVAC